ncbi:MAG: CRISPR-associated helicase Cas3' [Actinomycetota bacterium]
MPTTGSKRPRFAAHTPNDAGEWHDLAAHLRAVADGARDAASRFGAGELAFWAGLLHDLGKYTPEFQKYLDDCHRAAQADRPPPRPGTAPHKQHGAAVAVHRNLGLLAVPLLGHHGGLPSRASAQAEIKAWPAAALASLQSTAGADCRVLDAIPDLQNLIRSLCSGPLETELLVRMVFSCLVDADALDTERHFDGVSAERRSRPMPTLTELRDQLAAGQRALQEQAAQSPVNQVRAEVYAACVETARLSPGVFKLTVPTGGGKTRSSLAFALEHAVRHGLERVIYAIPYTSIVDQTAEVFESLFGADAVLEHHSALEPDEDRPDRELWRRLACQNWDAPLIVTTTVQLFESLFGNRPGRSRKVHRLAKAVIVLDEAQTLPPELLTTLVDGLRLLCERYGSTVVLCTATQPALGRETLAGVGFENMREIAPDPPRLFAHLKRVAYDLAPLAEPDWTWERAAEEMRGAHSCLAILNTRKDAVALFTALNDPDALFLSTDLCGRHRRHALAEIRRRLKANEPCRVVSTQLVEAGVDLDFPRVLRAVGPLDRIVQAAGRCNREGRWAAAESRVTVFMPSAGSSPRGSYRVAMDSARRLLKLGEDLHAPEIFERYFQDVYGKVDLDPDKIQRCRERFDFPEVARLLRLIDDDTSPVLVPYGAAEAEIQALLDDVRRAPRITRELWRRAQPFLVTLRQTAFERFQNEGLIEMVALDLPRWRGHYDDRLGLRSLGFDPLELIV